MKRIVLLFALIFAGLTASAQNLFKYPLYVGVNGSSGGSIQLNGSTSGSALIRVAAAAGSVTFQLPTTNGTNGYVLTTNGSGVTSWATAPSGMIYPSGSGIPLVVSGTSWGTTIPNNSANWNTAYGWGNHASAGYALSNNTTLTGTVTLPSTTSVGTVSSTELGYIDGLNGTAASRQNIKDSSDVWLAAAHVGIRRIDSTGYDDGNYLPRYSAELLVDQMNNTLLRELRMLGADMVAIPVGASDILTQYINMTDGRLCLVACYLSEDTTLTGVSWVQRVQGVYTSDNYNGVALFTVSGTTLTRVAYSTDDGNIWKGGGYTKQSKAFSSPYTATRGMYFIGFLYNSSAESTAPSIYSWNLSSGVSQLVTGAHKTSGYLSSQATVPSSTTAASITAEGNVYGVWLY